jgi:hypothetical protein
VIVAEDFIYFLWQYHQYSPEKLKTTDGKSLVVVNPGFRNSDSGPDFNEAHVKIEDMSWFGQVEMHIRSSDWLLHKHHIDPAYNNVVLHVVWEHDEEVHRPDGTTMPTIVLNNIVDSRIYNRYRLLQEALEPVPCSGQTNDIEEIRWFSMLDRCAVERLERKAIDISTILQECNDDWEETTYRLTLKYLGFKVNATPMEQLSKKLPYKILKKNAHQPAMVEALLFGQAGLLGKRTNDYVKGLFHDYSFGRKKYTLQDPVVAHLWKFMRMRPANFPTLRLAQFAAIVIGNPHLFSLFLHEQEYKMIEERLRLPLSGFWNNHYHFDKSVRTYNPVIGKQAIQVLAVNVIAPLRAAYAQYVGDQSYMDSALNLLQQLPAERNKVIKAFDHIHFNKKTAFDSQAMINLYDKFCSQKQCLNCDIGIALMKK